jgi:diguanylate cyclase (GGDEF)-like protein
MDVATRTSTDGAGHHAGLSDERIALGRALQARAGDIAVALSERFDDLLHGEARDAGRLGTELIARWLVTDAAAADSEMDRLAAQGGEALVRDVDLADVAKAYFAWRDLTLEVVNEEAARLGSSEQLVAMVRTVVRLSADGALVRIVRQFDVTRRSLQEQLRAEQSTLAHRALHDQLTGLPNRTLLTDRLRQVANASDRNETRAMLLFLDLDNFKAINDRFGHAAGDVLLQVVAQRLSEVVRSGDTVSRLGGDEFVVLATALDQPDEAARSLAERIHRAMQEPVLVDGREMGASVSIGIAPVLVGSDPEVCLAQADAAMYQAKRHGPSRYESYSSAIGMVDRRQSRLVSELHAAMERHQLTLHYQPLFRVGGDLVGMEAFLRWEHPELGMVQPAEFIPLLEQSREIVPIGRWVLAEATAQCRIWQDRGLDGLTISVNVSPRQLQYPDFYDDVSDALEASGLDPDCLVLEISESALIRYVNRISGMMESIRGLGVHLAIDDFGTGYSSLLYLRGLPVDRLKVDRGFVRTLGEAGHDPGVMSRMVDLAHALGLRVVAEGVETAAELRAVGAMRCDEAQGFLLGHPGPPESALP